jgi:RNA polymerase sigma-70 factor (ECF subfamily)
MASPASLVQSVQQGDPRALAAIYSAHAQPLIAFIRKKVGDRKLAEDILHDVFLNIWSRYDTWEVHSDLATYLFSAARNHVYSHYAKQRVRRAHAEAERLEAPGASEPAVAERLDAENLHAAVATWIDELPDRRREIFELSRYEYLTYQEIAARLGISIKTVETQMSRSLKHLRNRLRAYDEAAVPSEA